MLTALILLFNCFKLYVVTIKTSEDREGGSKKTKNYLKSCMDDPLVGMNINPQFLITRVSMKLDFPYRFELKG